MVHPYKDLRGVVGFLFFFFFSSLLHMGKPRWGKADIGHGHTAVKGLYWDLNLGPSV